MSEPIPEAIPTSSRDSRPAKRRNLGPRADHAATVSALFSNPTREIHIPTSTSLTKSSSSSLPPEIVSNVQGSSAGAGSGEFHVYKASRRREYERLRAMDEEVAREGEEKEFKSRREELERRDAEKTEKNRAKRAKALARKQKAKGGKKEGGEAAKGEKRKLVPNVNAVKGGDEDKEGKDEEGKEEGQGEVRNEEEIGLVIEDDD